jgi:hypothetical protein
MLKKKKRGGGLAVGLRDFFENRNERSYLEAKVAFGGTPKEVFWAH